LEGQGWFLVQGKERLFELAHGIEQINSPFRELNRAVKVSVEIERWSDWLFLNGEEDSWVENELDLRNEGGRKRRRWMDWRKWIVRTWILR
jgi:hypothetical protein